MSAAEPTGPRILLVDDDEALTRALRRRLRRHRPEWEIVVAAEGNAALVLIRQEMYDLVVTDMLMPDCDGIEMIAAMRRERCRVPIIAMSGGGRQDGQQVLEMARLLGACSVLDKPFSFDDLLRCADSAIGDPARDS